MRIRIIAAIAVATTLGTACGDDNVSHSKAVEMISEQTKADSKQAECIVSALDAKKQDLNQLTKDKPSDSFFKVFTAAATSCLTKK